MTETTLILRPSAIHGVGVFTTRKIKLGDRFRLFARKDYAFRMVCSATEARYCIRDKAGFHAPADFLRMSVGWHLNHSKKPNTEVNVRVNYGRALRDIKAGEELTIDYRSLGEPTTTGKV